jgi:hypothetical protein
MIALPEGLTSGLKPLKLQRASARLKQNMLGERLQKSLWSNYLQAGDGVTGIRRPSMKRGNISKAAAVRKSSMSSESLKLGLSVA